MGGFAWEYYMDVCKGTYPYVKRVLVGDIDIELPEYNVLVGFCQWKTKKHACLVAPRASSRNFRVFAESTASSRNGTPGDKVVMVDPLEAKRLAAKQMEMLKAKEKFKRQRQIEAINGAWAMIGLTAGVVIEGQTGDGILAQLDGYWMELSLFLQKFIPL